ncbi:MAG: UDP-N-acetylmuramoyl-L-alanyl-D-glutamate--2,6-diaminopimelate ligase [Betaproteobacteria bacterium]|nr:UDP-N-acetylmuramoyl-L-alanyl-D-glutamate--2,6-diaminopimelate ligase [Betaproteobacteria bacterium]
MSAELRPGQAPSPELTTASVRNDACAPDAVNALEADFTERQLANALAALPIPVNEVTSSSREARRGIAFLAYPGAVRDGRDFIGDAVLRGAAAVLYEAKGFVWNTDWKVPHLGVPDLKAHASQIAGVVYGHPADALWMTGVTGTNGKTSVSQWISKAMELAGRKSAVIGTIGNGLVGNLQPSDNTTPDAAALQRMLRDYLHAGATACAMEVSSHGLDQGRVADIKYDVAVFTNLTRDHLDYHGTMEQYGEAKARLFDQRGVKHAVINVDDAFGAMLAARLANRPDVEVIRYSMRQSGAAANLAARNVAVSPSGLSFDVAGKFGTATVESDILGAFNVGNLLAVIGTLIASGMTLAQAAELAGRLPPVRGRMQTVRVGNKIGGNTGEKPLVVVDYAHTPDALEKALSTIAAIVPENGRLISVFGCGGDRDRGKRPLMGAISARYADVTIITSDNPRTEDPQRIIADIEAGIDAGLKVGNERGNAKGAAHYRAVVDRQQGIYEALNEARPGDIVFIAGKGHEDYQIIGETRHHFSDVEVAQEALSAWRGGRS